ncbi:hypothetical protein [Streptomyces boninensis]|uniref:hypothetical protein n=1 Tax=Streptomyces boninensis TaxID=2039455 RepID=UPI003B21A5A4
MKSLLWFALFASLVVNVFVSLAMPDSALRLLCNIVSGVVVIGSGVGLWMLRGSRTGRTA